MDDSPYMRPRQQTSATNLNGRPPGITSTSPANALPSTMSRAERFEDEKRRIIDSCFSKTDPNGQSTESYITHIRVVEDAAYPQSPPPPESLPANKKPRVVVVAVKNTGRVRMHKGRENPNGTFSIGKTWNLDDLTGIQSYANVQPQNEDDSQKKLWAGDVGFTVTLTKPYYWQANTAKEKEFFIASLVKIFRKYTQGRVPDLLGFNSSEIDSMLGLPAPRQGGTTRPDQWPPDATPVAGPDPADSRPSPDPAVIAPLSSSRPNRPSASSEDISSQRMRQPQKGFQPPPAIHDRNVRQIPSREQVRSRGGGFGSTDRITPQASRSDLDLSRENPNKSVTSLNGPTSPFPPNLRRARPSDPASLDEPPPNFASRTISNESRKLNGLDGTPRRDPSPRGLRPSTAQSNASSGFSGASGPRRDEQQEEVSKNSLPERRRPPMEPTNDSSKGLGAVSAGEKPAQITPDEPLKMPGGYFSGDTPPRSPALAERRDAGLPKSPMPHPTERIDNGSRNRRDEELKTPPLQESETPDSASNSQHGDDFRPGLGPMVKKKGLREAANNFKKAATTYNAFKPRAGGGADRFFGGNKSESNEPDGINAVVPAPAKTPVSTTSRTATPEPLKSPPASIDSSVTPKRPLLPPAKSSEVPEVTVSSPPPHSDQIEPDQLESISAPNSLAVEKPDPQELAKMRRKSRTTQQLKYLTNLGVDTSMLMGRGISFEAALYDLGWGDTSIPSRKQEQFEVDLRRELSSVEAGSWLTQVEQKDDRIEAVEKMLDKAIAECDELEGLLTLYNVELSSLNDDIAFIEAQSQGLQVQTANQKILQVELQNLIETISVSSRQLEPLKRAPFGKPDGLEAIESSLLLLYKAMITIDPSLRQTSEQGDDEKKRSSVFGTNELSQMRALLDKRDRYVVESSIFLERLRQFMDMSFGAAFMDTKDALANQLNGASQQKLDVGVHDIARDALWQYRPLLLFAKEIDRKAWETLIRSYQACARPIYQDELRDNVTAWKKMTRKPTGEEQDVLFTTQEKDGEGLSSTARKLTVKRSQTLAKGLRSMSSEKVPGDKDKSQPGRCFPYEAFAGVLEETWPLILTEQNFIVDFFHANSSENADLTELIVSAPPGQRRGTNLYAKKLFESDRAMAKRVQEVMEEIFSSWPNDMQNLVEWAVKTDPLQGVGILFATHKTISALEDTNQDFLTRTLHALSTRLAGLFARFVDEQVRAIEDTKVKIKKRKGVIAFVRTFPHFSASIENMIPNHEEDMLDMRLEARNMVDDAYQKINRAMFESLRVIAKEGPAVTAGDPEDKEALNYHILLIENMNHYVEEVDDRNDVVLAEWRQRAMEEMNEHMALYVDAVVRRPLGKLMEFVESTESLLETLPPESPPSSIASRSSHARSLFKKLLAQHDGKEVRRGIDALKKRVDKHFGDADDPGLSRNLVAKVLKECELKFEDVLERAARVREDVYANEVELELRKEDIARAFAR